MDKIKQLGREMEMGRKREEKKRRKREEAGEKAAGEGRKEPARFGLRLNRSVSDPHDDE
jgi:hypothetical protein